ncbi:MAG: hypothetical protein NC121_10510 [Blautia sp.]|nr:hypothetical protein [Blautia sp.]
MKYHFNYCWHFLLADAFPMKEAVEKWKDDQGRYFYERDYREQGWQEVTLPHTFNDGDLFVAPIQDAGSGQKRTCAFYRKMFSLEEAWRGSKILLEFEGMRQTCYLYVNGRMAGYYEAGVAPFGFDITSYVEFGGENLIALATDNTATRNIDFCIAETPNEPGVEPGSYLLAQDKAVPEDRQGVGFFWNCNDFNPSLGGITRPVYLHVKPKVYLTLPLYSNLQTKGVYVYGSDYDLEKGTARVHVEAELRNESGREARAQLRVSVEKLTGIGAEKASAGHLDGIDAETVLAEGTGEASAETVLAEGTSEASAETAFAEGTDGIDTETVLAEGSDEASTEMFSAGQSGSTCVHVFSSGQVTIPAGSPVIPPLSITPADAYKKEILADGRIHYVPREEEEVSPTVADSVQTVGISAVSDAISLRFWNLEDPFLYRVRIELLVNGDAVDQEVIETGFRKVEYDKDKGIVINGHSVWLTGYAQRSTNEWAAIGVAPEWLKDQDMMWLRESNSNHIRWMHVAATLPDIRSCDRHGVVCTQPAGDKEKENFGRQWNQRVELMRDIIIAFRNHPSILFWEAGNNSISLEHMREMTALKRLLDSDGGRFMGCRTINTEDVVAESEYVGTMLNRHAARFLAEHGPITETEYSREEAPRRIWDDFTPPDFDYRNKYIGKGGKKQVGRDFWDLTMEEMILAEAGGYAEFFHDRIGGASGKDMYSAAAALCWTDSAQHGRQSWSENGRMSGRVDPVRIRKQNFYLYQVMQSGAPMVKVIGHWNYPPEEKENYRYPLKKFNGEFWEETGEYAYREPNKKTVYVAGSYHILRMELWINGERAGTSGKPVNSFLFPFENIDVTRKGERRMAGSGRNDSGVAAGLAGDGSVTAVGCGGSDRIEAVGFDEQGREVARDVIYTAGKPAKLHLTLHTSPQGFLADGADVAYLDVEVLDGEGRLCPLCDSRIDFVTEGEAQFLGGYNSGRFNGYGKADSVIHQEHVYAECGNNRVFLRSTFRAGKISVKAVMEGVPAETVAWESVAVEREPLSLHEPNVWYADYSAQAPEREDAFPAIPAADALKYQAPEQDYCKILIQGQEPDNGGVPSVNRNGSVWGSVLIILERMLSTWPDRELFTYGFDREKGMLTVHSGDNTILAEAGRTHLLVNGQENLMDGEPYVTERGAFVMEVNALIPYIRNVSCQYDDRVHVLRIELK